MEVLTDGKLRPQSALEAIRIGEAVAIGEGKDARHILRHTFNPALEPEQRQRAEQKEFERQERVKAGDLNEELAYVERDIDGEIEVAKEADANGAETRTIKPKYFNPPATTKYEAAHAIGGFLLVARSGKAQLGIDRAIARTFLGIFVEAGGEAPEGITITPDEEESFLAALQVARAQAQRRRASGPKMTSLPVRSSVELIVPPEGNDERIVIHRQAPQTV